MVDGEYAVGVAVEGEAHVRRSLDDGLLQLLGMRGPAARVDVGPIGTVEDHVDSCPEAAQHIGRHEVTGPVGAVHDDV